MNQDQARVISEKFEDLRKTVESFDKELHDLKHTNANIQVQVNGIYKSMESISNTLERFMSKYEGDSEIGYAGKMAEIEKDIKTLKEAYEIGKMWKIKISGFFLALSTIAGLVALFFAITKGLVWIWQNILINKK